MKRFLDKTFHRDGKRSRTPSAQSRISSTSSPATAPLPVSTLPSSSSHLLSSITPPKRSLAANEKHLRARKEDVRKKSDALQEELIELEKRARELQTERDARSLELERQKKETEEEANKKRDAISTHRSDLERQVENEVKAAEAEVKRLKQSRMGDIYKEFPMESPAPKPVVPWDPWELDPDFFAALSRWTLDNPESTLDKVFEKISDGIDRGTPLLELIPDSPFPARGLVGALAQLLKLGVTVSRAKRDVRDFAIQVIRWVSDMKAAFQDGVITREGLSWRMQANLETRGNLIHQICVWATARLNDGRWQQMKNGLSIAKQIDDFRARISEARSLFVDASLINISQGITRIWNELELVRGVQHNQLKDIKDGLDAQRQTEARDKFMNQTLQSLVVANPTYDAQGKNPCDPDTRTEILESIRAWLSDFSEGSKSFLWLTGDPGAGKSAVTASVARECKNAGTLWAQFFINRNNVDTTDPKSFFPSIARQLADHSPDSHVARTIHDTLKAQQSLLDDISVDQALGLFVNAVTIASQLDLEKAVVIVIDGLDETERSRLRETAKIFATMFESLRCSNVKVFIASRTEDEIRKPFADTFKAQYVKHVHLDTAHTSSIRDVSTFLTRRITDIVVEHDLNWEEWPGAQRMQSLCDRASGLFIWAVTVVKFMQEQIADSGTECLNDLLNALSKDGMDGVNILYGTILRLTYKQSSDEWAFETFRRVVGCIVVLREPLSVGDIRDMLALRRNESTNPVDVVNFVRRLRTVLVAGADAIDEKTVPRLHKSFFEFITSDRADPQFRVVLSISDGELATKCLEHLVLFRKEYRASYNSSTAPDYSISSKIRYAARFWRLHLPQGFTSGLAVTAHTTSLTGTRSLLTSSLNTANQTPFGIQVPQGGSDISISCDKEVTLWNPVTGKQFKWPIQTEAPIHSVTFSPDGTRVVSGGGDNDVRLWDVRTGQAIGSAFKGHSGEVRSVAFSPDGMRIVSGGEDNAVRCWDLRTGQAIGSSLRGHRGWVESVAFSPDGTRIVSGSRDATIRLWDVQTGQLIGSPLQGHTSWVRSVTFSPDGTQLLSGSDDQTIRLWNAETGQAMGTTFKGHTESVWSVAFSPDGTRVISDGNKNIRIWDARTGHEITSASGMDTYSVNCVAFSPDGTQIASGSRDKTVRLWNALTGQPIGSPLRGHTSWVRSVAFSPDGTRIISGSNDKTIRFWDATTGQAITNSLSLTGHTGWVTSLAHFPDFSRMTFTSSDGAVRIWDQKACHQIGNPLISDIRGLISVAVEPYATRIAAATNAGTIYLWDAETRGLISQIKNSVGGITLLKFSPGGSELILSRLDGSVSRFDAKDGKLIKAPVSCENHLLSKDGNSLSFDMQRGWRSGESEEGLFHWFASEDPDAGLWAYVDGMLIRSNGPDSVSIFELTGN